MKNRPDRIELERRRDSQQWILDWVIKQGGRTHSLEYDLRFIPPEVKNYAQIPSALYRLGAHAESIARAAEAQGDQATARALYVKAADYYHLGQHAIFEDDNPDKIFLYERLAACYDRVIELSPYPIERVEIPWEGVSIQGLLHLLPGRPKAPVCLFIPGMDMVKEMFPDPGNNPFLERGMHLLSIDGPGQGISNLRKIRVTADNYERAASAGVSYLAGRPEVEAEKIVCAASSMGTYWGTRLMALDGRVKAMAGVAACYAGKRHIFEMSSPRFKQIFMYISGIHDEEAFDKMASQMHLQGYGRKIDRPMLMTAGEFDPLSPLDETLALYEELAGPKELWIFQDDFHGGVREGLPNLGGLNVFPYLADWLKRVIDGKLPADQKVMRLVPKGGGLGPYEPPIADMTLRTRAARK